MSVTDYSRWDNIELSDDEEKTPDCIEKGYWARLMHEKRVNREKEFKKEKDKINEAKKHLGPKIEKMKKQGIKVNQEDQKVIVMPKGQQHIFIQALDIWNAKEAELDEKIRKEPWNVDSIGQVKQDKTRITSKPNLKVNHLSFKIFISTIQQIAIEKRYTEEEWLKKFVKPLQEYLLLPYDYSNGNNLKNTEDFLTKNGELVCEYARDYYARFCLTLESEGHDNIATIACHNSILMDMILERAMRENVIPSQKIIPFFFREYR